MDREILKEVYMDFFGTEKETQDQKNIKMKKHLDDIDNLYITDESKNILKNIIEYMRKYNEQIETNYITFNLKIITDNKDLTDRISNILASSANSYNYLINNNIYNISLYKDYKMDDIYQKNGLIIINDFKAFDLLDTKDKEKFIHS